jgi:hypothetical protein
LGDFVHANDSPVRPFSDATSNGQTFTAFGATRIDDSTAATGFHANQKTMGTGTACFRGLVSAFHEKSLM